MGSNDETCFDDTYQAFLRQLVKTQCLYKGEEVEDLRVVQRQEQLFEMMSSRLESPKDDFLKEFVHFFTDVCDIARKKRAYASWGDPIMLETISKTLEKKGNKAHRLFFLNPSRPGTPVNVGSIVLNQSKHNSIQIRNFLYIMYLEACDMLYESGMPPTVSEIYRGILSFFESHDQDKEDIHSHMSSLLHDVLKCSGLVTPEITKQACDHFDAVTKDVISNLDGEKQAIVRSYLEKLDRNTILQGIQQIRDIVGTIDFSPLMPVVSKLMSGESIMDSSSDIMTGLIAALEEMGVYQLVKDWFTNDDMFGGGFDLDTITNTVQEFLGGDIVKENLKETLDPENLDKVFEKLGHDETLTGLFGKDLEKGIGEIKKAMKDIDLTQPNKIFGECLSQFFPEAGDSNN